MEKQLGMVLSIQNTPSLSKIIFQLNDNEEVHKGQFVEIEHPNGRVIALVQEVLRFNPYYSSIYTKQKSLENSFPVDDWSTTIVETKPLGIINENVIE